jgi:hypothetical protein
MDVSPEVDAEKLIDEIFSDRQCPHLAGDAFQQFMST